MNQQSIGRTTLNVKLDENDPDPYKTLEDVGNEIIRSRQLTQTYTFHPFTKHTVISETTEIDPEHLSIAAENCLYNTGLYFIHSFDMNGVVLKGLYKLDRIKFATAFAIARLTDGLNDVVVPQLPGEKQYVNRLAITNHLITCNKEDSDKIINKCGIRFNNETNVEFINRNKELIQLVNEIESLPGITYQEAFNEYSSLFYSFWQNSQNKEIKKQEVIHQPINLISNNSTNGINGLGGKWN